MKLIVGLGNPGKKFSQNRHNTGFHTVEYLAEKHSIQVKHNECKSVTGKGNIADNQVVIARPKTYVNLSGEAVLSLMGKYRVTPQDIIVIYDDLDLPVGRIRIRPNGSSGGHNGLKSIIAEIGTEFNRVKIGIGRPEKTESLMTPENKVVSHVLSNFAGEEAEIMKKAIPVAVEAIETILSEGITSAMNKYNKTAREKPEKKAEPEQTGLE